MSTETDTNLDQLLRKSSKKTLDAAQREVLILEEAKARTISDRSGQSLHEVYMKALELDICPCRYLRNRESISQKEQLKLARSRVAVVGAGGLGGSVLISLARVGIGNLVVIDHDIFDETNLNRQVLSTLADLGDPKADRASAVVASINPGVLVTSHRVRIHPNNVKRLLAGTHVVVDGLDNVPDRLILEEATRALGIPFVHGAVAGFEGHLMTIFPEDPGLRLLYGTGKAKDKALSPEAILGTPSPTPALIATLQVMEVLKILLERGKIFRNVMLHVDMEAGHINRVVFQDSDGE